MRASRPSRPPALALAVVLCQLAVARSAAAAAPLTLDDAVEMAMRGNPRLAAARQRLRAQGDSGASAGRRMLPAVRLNEELQVYDSPFDIGFGSMTFRARDQVTNTFAASASQPLLGLLRLNAERTAQRESTAATAGELAVLEADVREAVQVQFVEFFEAQALGEIAETSARELSEQVTVARARVASGVITTGDLLRLQVAVANARQQGLQARAQAAAARAGLLAQLGLPPDQAAGLALAEPRALLAAAAQPLPALAVLLPQARLRRPELLLQQHVAFAAAERAQALGYGLLPELDLEAAYTHINGQVFAPKDSAFVGVRASWAIWEWGASQLLRRAADAQAAAAHDDEQARERQVEAELQSNVALGEAARGAVDAAESAITSAEEAYRVTDAQVKAGAATTTDLLQAQAELTQARLNLTRARYQLALARVRLRRASGE